MSVPPAPLIDPRTAADVAGQLQQLLRVYAPDWNEVDPTTGAPAGVSSALIGVAARLVEILIQRLNQVPQKNFLAFLNMLGAALQPPQPARAPVTFMLTKGSLVDALVPAGTQVAAPPGAGEKDPVVYETENEIFATAAQLTYALARDPEMDAWADYSGEILGADNSGSRIFGGNRPMIHCLYLGQSGLLASSAISNLGLVVDLASPAGDDVALSWEIWSGGEWRNISPNPAQDGTRNLRQSGTIQFGRIPAAEARAVAGVPNDWMRCRLMTPITRSPAPRSGMVRDSKLPVIRSVGLQVHLHNEGMLIDEAYSSAIGVIDVTRDFYPFGEKPKFNDTLWLALEEAFSNGGAEVTLNVAVTSPPGGAVQAPPPANPSDDLKLRWEIWNGSWVELGTATKNGPVSGSGFVDTTNAFSRNGRVSFVLPPQVSRFTVNGKESFWIRVRIASGNYGVEGHYVAAPDRPGGFTYVPPSFQPPSISSLTAVYDLDKPAPQQPPAPPEAVLAENDSVVTNLTALNNAPGQTFTPFQPSADARPTFYLGFTLPAGRTTFANNTIAMFFQAADRQYGEKTLPLDPDVSRRAGDPGAKVSHAFFVTNSKTSAADYDVSTLGSQWNPSVTLIRSDGSSSGGAPTNFSLAPGEVAELDVQVSVPAGAAFGASDAGILQLVSADRLIHSAEYVTYCHGEPAQTQQLQLTWEYWNGEAWAELFVRDQTANLTVTGTIEFLAPPDFAPHDEFGRNAWWLRVRWEAGDYDAYPRIRRCLLNTTMATQAVTIVGEVLGSSDGSTANQTFQIMRAPVLAGQLLTVREPEAPSGDELKALLATAGPNAVEIIPDSAGKPQEIWVAWQEVTDFYASSPRSRDYALDHITGEVSFGDGQSGLIPPAGTANIRMASYRSGGGVRGNRPPGSIIQLKTTIPYVDKVTNAIGASGGADAESLDALLARAPMTLRHRHRAVTAEDYEDLVRAAASDVARVLCVPNRDLEADPLDRLPPLLGNVSVIIVPNSADARPQPSVELIRRVQQFVSTSCPVTANVLVVGPLYLRVDVEAEIGLASLDSAGTVAAKVQDRLAAFLHPLTGGFDKKGWAFGREPHRSDIYGVIEGVPEVDHIRALTVSATEALPGTRETRRFLVYSGIHRITLAFEP